MIAVIKSTKNQVLRNYYEISNNRTTKDNNKFHLNIK